jgi:elongation of very long chain fatty acids protein 6
VGLFIYSKIPELMDTVFLVLQKKRVIFLAWFHHTTGAAPACRVAAM